MKKHKRRSKLVKKIHRHPKPEKLIWTFFAGIMTAFLIFGILLLKSEKNADGGLGNKSYSVLEE